VLSIAHGLPEPLVDGNVQRVFARLFALEDPVGSTGLNKATWALAEALVPEVGAGEWNQALMELGATVCTARAPRCEACPVARGCAGREQGRAELLPRPKERRPPTEVELVVHVVRRGDEVLLERRPAEGRMAGLWQFPTTERGGEVLFPRALPDVDGAPPLRLGSAFGELRHSITRYRIRAALHAAELVGEVPAGWRWFSPAELADGALTGMTRKVLRARR